MGKTKAFPESKLITRLGLCSGGAIGYSVEGAVNFVTRGSVAIQGTLFPLCDIRC